MFSRGCMPDQRHLAPNALRKDVVVWDAASKTELLEGHVFLDGSRLHGEDVLLARAGWGVAMVRVVDQVEARALGPFTGLIQCIDAAEVFAGTMDLKLGLPPPPPLQRLGLLRQGLGEGSRMVHCPWTSPR